MLNLIMETNQNKQLKWHRTKDCSLYWAFSPVNNFVFVAYNQGTQWSHHIIFQKHLQIVLSGFRKFLNVEDLTFTNSTNRVNNMIDCASLRLKGSKIIFQDYVDNFDNLEKHSFDFYKLKDYAEEALKFEKRRFPHWFNKKTTEGNK